MESSIYALAAAGGITNIIIDKKMLLFVIKVFTPKIYATLKRKQKMKREKEELKKKIKHVEDTKNNIKKDALQNEELLQKDMHVKKWQKLL